MQAQASPQWILVVLLGLAVGSIAMPGCGSVEDGREGGGGDDSDGDDSGGGGDGADGGAVDSFAITTDLIRLDARLPEVAAIEVSVERAADFAEAVVVEATGLPPGVTAGSITIAPGAASGTLRIDTARGEPATLATVTLVGQAADQRRTANLELFLVGPAGSRDESFGTGGRVDLPAALDQSSARSLLALPDGRFVVTGTSAGRLFAAAFLADGTGDFGFGEGGITIVDFGGAGIASVSGGQGVLQGEAIVLAGSGDGQVNGDLVLARVGLDGALDPSFAGGGSLVYPIGSQDVGGSNIALDSEGRIHLVGNRLSGTAAVIVARFTPNGLLDPSFAGDGVAIASLGQNGNVGTAVATGPDGRVLATGVPCGDLGCYGVTLLAFDDTGAPDVGFGKDGQLVLDGLSGPGRISVLGDGDLLIPMGEGIGEEQFVGVHRRNPDGALDPSFGEGGEVALSVPAAGMVDLVVDGDDAIALGDTADGLLLTRLDVATGALDASFGADGLAVHALSGQVISVSRLALRDEYRLIVLFQRIEGGSVVPSVLQFWY